MCRDGLLTFSVRFREEREKYLSSSSAPSSSPNRYLPDPSSLFGAHNGPHHNAEHMLAQIDFQTVSRKYNFDRMREIYIFIFMEKGESL